MRDSGASIFSISTRSLCREWGPLALLVGLAAFLRLWGIGLHSLWQDELIWADWSTQASALAVVKNVCYPHSPFFALFNYYLNDLLLSDVYARVFPALFGILTVPALYLLGKGLFNSSVGFAAAFLLSVSPIHVDFSRQVEPYTLQVFCVTLFAWSLWTAWHSHRRSIWFLVSVFAAASMYAQILSFFPLVLLTAAVSMDWLLSPPRNWRRLIPLVASLAGGAILYMPWVLFHPVAAPMSNISFERPFPGLFTLAEGVLRGNDGLDSLLPIGAVVAGLVICVMAARTGKSSWRPFLYAATLLLTAPSVLAFLWFSGWQVNGRYVMSSVIALALLGGLAIQQLRLYWKSRRRPSSLPPIMAGALSFAILFVFNMSALGEIYAGPAYQDFRGLLGLVQRNIQPGDAVFTTACAARYMFERYAPEITTCRTRTSDDNWTDVRDALAQNKRVWLIRAWNLSPALTRWLKSEKYPSMHLHTGQTSATLSLFWPDKQTTDAVVTNQKRRLLKDALEHHPWNKSRLYMQLAETAELADANAGSAPGYWTEALRLLNWEARFSPFSQRVHENRITCYDHLHNYLQALNEYRFLHAISPKNSAGWFTKQKDAYKAVEAAGEARRPK